ncbi:106_t:CDS:2, partial [Ambispora leptoticha]
MTKSKRQSKKPLQRSYNNYLLPEEYFTSLDSLPTNIANLYPAVRDLFPITDRKCLRELGYYKRQLSLYYECTKISPHFFELPPPKARLPLAYQDLSPKYRRHFPIDPNNIHDNTQKILEKLREEYTFKNLPNNYYQQEAIDFIDDISSIYKFNQPLSPEIMTVNPTEKPDLPNDPQLITKYSILTPITSTKTLTE